MGAERGGVRGRRTARSGVDRYGNQRRSWGFAAASLLVSFGGGRSGIPACRSCAGGRLPEDRDRTTADNFGRDACAFRASPSIGAYRVVNFSLAWVVKFSLAPKPLGDWLRALVSTSVHSDNIHTGETDSRLLYRPSLQRTCLANLPTIMRTIVGRALVRKSPACGIGESMQRTERTALPGAGSRKGIWRGVARSLQPKGNIAGNIGAEERG